jgi:hypothetical protein
MKELTRTNDFKEFFAWIGGGAGSAVSTFGAMFVNIMHGIMNVMVAFTPISNSMQGGLRGMTESFVRWSNSIKTSDRFKEFVSFFLAAGPTFLTFFKQFSILVNDVVHAFAPLGMVMLRVINVILALFNYMTAFVLSLASAAARARDLGNAIRTLFGFQKKAAGESKDALIDVDQIYKDMFGSIGDVEDGIKDAQKAAEGFLASFDEVHNIPDFDSGGGGFTPPKAPTGGSGSGGITPVVDEEEVQTSKGWLQSLIDKIKEIPPLIPMRIDPPDGGGGFFAVAIDNTVKSVQTSAVNMVVAFQTASTAVQTAWHGMLDYMQVQLNAYNPFLTYGWNLLMLTLSGVVPVSEAVNLAWHNMLDYMQSQLNAYRPYLEYGFTLLAAGLSSLAATALGSAANWERAFQAIGNAVSAATSPIIDNINSVRSAYASLMAMMKQPIEIPSIQLPAMPKIEMPSIVSNIQDTLKNFDYGEWFKGAVKDLGEAAVDIGLGATGLKGAQGAAKAAEIGWPAVKQWLEGLMQGGGKAITGFANGGIIGNDSIVRVGEGGRQEAIVPLGGKAMQPFANAIASSMGGGAGGGGQDIVLQIDGVEFARITAQYNIQESKRIGGNMMTIT